jgi:hypothetical protein
MHQVARCGTVAAMFKKKPSIAKPAEQRLSKVAVKRVRVAKAERARFLAEVKATQPTEAGVRKAGKLVERVRAAKAAPFLQQYRIAA